MRDLPLPDDTGQHWSLWLWDYARFVHDALVDDPEIIGHLLAGEINVERKASTVAGWSGCCALAGSPPRKPKPPTATCRRVRLVRRRTMCCAGPPAPAGSAARAARWRRCALCWSGSAPSGARRRRCAERSTREGGDHA